MSKVTRNIQGFTLIELLVVILILIGVGSIISSILYSTLRGANKANTLNEIRREGASAISEMSRIIQNGANIVAPTCNGVSSYFVTVWDSLNQNAEIIACSNNTLWVNNTTTTLISSATKVASCSQVFTCTSTGFSAPTVKIDFKLQPSGSSSFSENTGVIEFQTTVSPRNYGN